MEKLFNRIENIRNRWQFRTDAEKWEEDLHPRDEDGRFASKDSNKGKEEEKPKKSRFPKKTEEKKEDEPKEKENDFSKKDTEYLKEHYRYTAGSVVLSKARLDVAKIMGDKDGVEEYEKDYDLFMKNMMGMSDELEARGEKVDAYTQTMYDCARDGVIECETAIEGILDDCKGEEDQDKLLESVRKIKELRDVEYGLERDAVENGRLKISVNESPHTEADFFSTSEEDLDYERNRCDYSIRWAVRDCEAEAKAGLLTADKVESASDYIKSMRDKQCIIDKLIADRSRPVEKPSYNNATETAPQYKSEAMQEYAKRVQMPKVETSIPSLKKWQDCASEYINNYVSDGSKLWGMDTEELVSLKNNFQKIVDNSELCLNFNSGILDKVVTGRFKNQFETGTTDGSPYLGARAEMANNLFGLSHDASGVDREKFGYMADKHDFKGTLGVNGPWYGVTGDGDMCMATFKKDKVANRTTYTLDDSLEAYTDGDREKFAAGMIDGDVSIEGISFNSERARAIADGTAKKVSDIVKDGSYVECQYHGVLDIEDVESFRFASKDEMDNATLSLTDEAKKRLKDLRIQFGYFDSRNRLRLYEAEEVL